MPETHLSDDATEEHITLVIALQRDCRATAEQAIIGMVVNNIYPKAFHQLVEAMRCGSLEPAIGAAGTPHSHHHLVACRIEAHHLAHRLWVVLEVGVDSDDGVGLKLIHGGVDASQQSVLVAAVGGKLNAGHARVGGVMLANELPGIVARTVVHQQQTTIGGGLAVGYNRAQDAAEALDSGGQHLLLVVARHYYHHSRYVRFIVHYLQFV